MRGRVVSSVGRRCRVAVAAFAAFAAATGVAGAAAPTYNLNGTWSMTLHCKVTIPSTLIVTHWKSSTGTLKQNVIIGRRAEKGTATESGNTVTDNSSNRRASIDYTRTITKFIF